MSLRSLNSNRFLVALIGIDYSLLSLSPRETRIKFFWASRFVVLIILLTIISVFYAFELMFHKWYIEIFLALFISFMFGTIYVLLIQTFSKQQLGAKKGRFRLNWSNLTRGVFVVFIGFLISKPLEILFFRNELEKDIETYKVSLTKEFEYKTDKLLAKDVLMIQHQYNRAKAINATSELDKLNKNLATLTEKKKTIIINAASWISLSDFFLRRVQIVATRYPFSKVICFIIILLFAAPVVMIYMISSTSAYYRFKQERDERLVQAHYDVFSRKYTMVLAKKIGLQRSFYESHVDPPFRTQLISPTQFVSQEDYFKSLEQ